MYFSYNYMYLLAEKKGQNQPEDEHLAETSPQLKQGNH